MKTVCITGGNKGIGFATAELFLQRGYRVVITGRSEEKLISACQKLGGTVSCVVWDVSNVSDAKSAVERVHECFGNVDVFVNNAGIVCDDDIGEHHVDFFHKTEAGWDATMNVNLKGMFFALQAEALYLKEHSIEGNIVNVCSEMGFRPAPNAYGISKWGVRGLTIGLGRDLAKFGIVVNGIAPGETATEILRQTEGEIKALNSPRGHQATPREIGEAIVFLAESRNIIGEILVSDGGRRLK